MEESNPKLTAKSLPGSKILDYETAEKTDNLSQLQDILRDSFIQYKETAQRCQIQFKSRALGEKFNRLYYTPNVAFLDEPEKQKEFRNEFIKDVGQLPEPKPLFCLADQLHADALEAIGDCSDPKVVKEQLSKFFTRRQAQLQHKKHKIIKRWADAYLSAEDIDKVQEEFDKELSYLQIEQDSIASRLMRIVPDDRYSNQPENVERPKPTGASSSIQSRIQTKDDQQALLYAETDREQPNASALRQDDFEVFIRQKTYLNRVLRPAKKLIQSLKWLSYDQRYDIWGDSRILMHEYQQNFAQEKFKILFTVAEEVKRKLAEIGVVDEKGVSVCTERYVFHLKGKGFTTRTQQMLNSHQFDHQEPPLLVASLAELKVHLVELANGYGLNCSQIDLDQGQQFTYQLQTFFPGKFESQINALTFDWEDSGHQTELQIIERLTKNLNLSKDSMIEELSRHCAEQRQNSILNALNVGKTGQQDASLKDLTENALDKDQFIRYNLIRKLRTIEFFSLDETDIRIRRADWLEYVCWQPTINTHVQRQNQLLSGSSNSIDHLLRTAIDFTDVQDSVTVNKVLEESASYHIKKIEEVQQQIAQCYGAPSNLKGTQNEGQALMRSLHQATNPGLDRNSSKLDPNLNEAQQAQYNRFADVPNVDPLAQNLTKAFYTLRLIKTRDVKIQMLHVLNYFRAIQRILALEVRENMTREKGLGDYSNVIDPHFGKNGDNQGIAKQQPPSGPSDIFNSNIIREMDTVQRMGNNQLDPVTLKAYKLKNRFETVAISTCPLVAKHHRTFGQKIVEQSVSAENDNQHFQQNQKKAHAMITKRDRIHVDLKTKEVYVTNEYGSRIIYYEAFNDLVEIEDELVKIGSYYINQHEILIQNQEIMELETSSRPTSLIDRAEIALELMEKEYQFQFGKIQLVEQFMEAYEHIYDPLESMRVLQMIVDLIAERPRLNLEAAMYSESYDSEIQLLNIKSGLFQDFFKMQKEIEKEENQDVHAYLELKHRKIQESIDQYWIEVSQKQKLQKRGSDEPADEDLDDKEDISELLRQKLEQNQLQAASRKQALDEIKRRHITEFANEQFSDFAQVLGLPQVTAEELYRRFDQKEPIILDALRENAFFQKMVEGYPVKFVHSSHKPQKLGLHTQEAGLTDFYDSMQILSKFNAVLAQNFAELQKETLPENGFAVSCLETCMYKKAKLVIQRRQVVTKDGIDGNDLKGQHLFEEDFYFGYSDKLIQVMKELHVEFHPDNIYKRSNPLVAGKLDIKVSVSLCQILLSPFKTTIFPEQNLKKQSML